MADNTTLPGSGEVIADEDIAGVKFQKVKLVDSAAGSTSAIGTAANPLPVSIATMPSTAVTGPLTDTQLRVTPVPISGTVTASGPVTDTQLRATAVPVSLASMPSTPVTGTFYQTTQPVSGTFYQTTQPISLTDATTGLAASVSAGGFTVRDNDVVALLQAMMIELRVQTYYLQSIANSADQPEVLRNEPSFTFQ